VRKTVSIFIVVVVVSLLLGCGGGETPTTTPTSTAAPTTAAPTIMLPTELVPQKANMIGHIDLSQIIADEDIAALYEAMPMEPGDPQTLDEALDLAMEESDLDLRDFGEGLMFGEISGATGDMDYFGIVVKGTFEESDLIASIESERDERFTTVNYKGYQIYEICTDPDEEMGIAFLGSDAFVIGPMEAVKDVIAVKEGDQSAVSGKLLDMYNDLGDGLVKVAIEVPPGVIEEGLQEVQAVLPLPIDLSRLADIETTGVTLAKNKQAISLACWMCFTSSDSAEAAETMISAAILFANMMPDIPEEALALLENLDVSVSDSCLDVTLEMTMSEIETLITNITHIADTVTSRGGAQAFETDQGVIQLATASFYSDVHGGYNNTADTWCDSNFASTTGHYYPTSLSNVGDHVLVLSTTNFDRDNTNNPRVDEAVNDAAETADITAHAIWMGLLVNWPGDFTAVAGGSTDRDAVSPLQYENGPYLNEIPESAMAGDTYNGGPAPGGGYCWIVGKYGAVYGAYQGTDGNWYSGFNGTYP